MILFQIDPTHFCHEAAIAIVIVEAAVATVEAVAVAVTVEAAAAIHGFAKPYGKNITELQILKIRVRILHRRRIRAYEKQSKTNTIEQSITRIQKNLSLIHQTAEAPATGSVTPFTESQTKYTNLKIQLLKLISHIIQSQIRMFHHRRQVHSLIRMFHHHRCQDLDPVTIPTVRLKQGIYHFR